MLSMTEEYDGKLGILERFRGANLTSVSDGTFDQRSACLLWMRPGEYHMPFADLAIHDSRLCIPGGDMQIFGVAS